MDFDLRAVVGSARRASFAVGIVFAAAAPAHAQVGAHRAVARTPVISVSSSYASLPIGFEPNLGQSAPSARFVAHGPAYSLAVSPTTAHITFQHRLAGHRPAARPEAGWSTASINMDLVGGNSGARMRGDSQLPGKVNYLMGSDPSHFTTNVPTFRRVKLDGVYPGVDLVYYGNQRQLEYDFIVRPHADPSRIGLRFSGVKDVRLARTGDLVLDVPGGSVRWRKPIIYQKTAAGKSAVAGHFVLKSRNQVGFVVARYDRDRPLIIDPVFAYSTYLGGSANDSSTSVTLDAAGNAYITGQTASNNFPGTTSPPGVTAGFVTKLSASGSTAIYSTYIGQAFGQAIAVNPAGEAYVAGLTTTPGLPIVNGLQTTYGGGGSDGFLMKINSAGNGLLYSTLIGGSDFDFLQAVALAPDGTVCVAGYTLSANFPTRNPLQAAFAGGSTDAIVCRIDTTQSGSASLLYSTYLGGASDDAALGIAVDSSNRIYAAGRTSSAAFPTVGAFQANLAGSQNAFVSVYSADGSQLLYSTYFGGSGFDVANGLAIDAARHAYITGSTSSPNLPVKSALVPTYGGGGDAFAAKLDTAATGNASLVYSTYLGGQNADSATSIGVDVWGNAYIVGYTYNTASPQDNNVFLLKLGSGGGNLLYSALFGGTNIDLPNAIAVDPLGAAIIAGSTQSTDFPVSASALRKQSGGGQDAFVVRIPTFTRLDLNHDSSPDLLFQNTANGSLVTWFMQGDQETSYSFLSPSQLSLNWKVVGSGDLNGDGNTDLVLQDSNTGNLAYWTMNGTTQIGVDFITPNNPGANWNVVGVADMNRDGYADLIFQNSVSGDMYVWYMHGTTMVNGDYISPRNPGTGWNVVAVGDMDNDGQADLVFQNSTTGNIYVWFMRGNTMINGGFTSPMNPGAGWTVAGLSDFTGDGLPELVFQNLSTGQLQYWMLNGLTQTSVNPVRPNNPGSSQWRLVGIH